MGGIFGDLLLDRKELAKVECFITLALGEGEFGAESLLELEDELSYWGADFLQHSIR